MVAAHGPISCGSQALEYAGFSSCGAGSVVTQHVESSQTRGRTRVPGIGRHILIHCATREVLKEFLRRDVRKISLGKEAFLDSPQLVLGLVKGTTVVAVLNFWHLAINLTFGGPLLSVK